LAALTVTPVPLGLAPAGAAPAQAAEACPAAFPVAELTAGTTGEGLTVETGTSPDPFTVTVLGVLDDGIAPGIDMILAETESPALERAGGVWAGMSGSPVYATDGRLIGAVAYGLAGASTIAGITPAVDMYQLLERPAAASSTNAAATIDLPAALERRAVDSGGATAAEAAAGLRQLPVPLGISGVGQNRIDAVAERLGDRLPGTRVYAAGATGVGDTADPSEIFPGSNYAAAISYGDASFAGVGTTTAVCTVGSTQYALAFGHPFNLAGATTMSTHVADALTIQPDPIFGPFKVANLGGIAGLNDQDRTAGIRAALGGAPTPIPITSTITSVDDGSSREGTTQLNLQSFAPDAAFSHLIANLDRVADRIGGGEVQLRWVIEGTRASGAPFTVDVSNRYADPVDVTIESVFDVADQLYLLDTQPYEDAKITSVDLTGSVSSAFRRYTIDHVLLRTRSGGFSRIAEDEPLQVGAGSRLNLRVVLEPYRGVATPGDQNYVDLSLVIPPDTAGQDGAVDILGGPDFDSHVSPTNFDRLLTALRGTVPNDAVTAQLELDDDPVVGAGGRARKRADAVVVGDTSFDIEVVRPPTGRPAVVDGRTWRLRSTLSTGPAASTFNFGTTTDTEVMGDWDGNGSVTPATFRNGAWTIRASGATAATTFSYGRAGDIPVAGDWNGDGRDTIGVYRDGHWFLRNTLASGPTSVDFTYGRADQRPVVGDWNGDGIDSIGVYRSGNWSLRFSNSAGPADRTMSLGTRGDLPVVGEWDGDGRDEVGVYRDGQWLLRDALTTGPANRSFSFGGSTSHPLVWG
jgi:hypothetical protein